MRKKLITKFLGILVLGFWLSTNVFAADLGVITHYKLGKGTLKVTEDVAHILEYFFSGGTRGVYAEKQKSMWKPGLIAISVDGSDFSFFRHPYSVTDIDNKRYGAMAISDCQKKSGKECFLFANGYKIVWDNGSDKKKRRLKRKDIKAGKTLVLLKELGFYAGYTQANSNKTKETSNKTSTTEKITTSDGDIVKKIKELKKLYDEGILTKDEFEKAKKKLLN